METRLLTGCKWVIIILVIVFSLYRCNNKERIKYTYIKAKVYKTKLVHWGHGAFNNVVYYEFYLNDSLYQFKEKIKNFQSVSAEKIQNGDSILVRFPKNHVKDIEVIRRTYIKSRNYHIN